MVEILKHPVIMEVMVSEFMMQIVAPEVAGALVVQF